MGYLFLEDDGFWLSWTYILQSLLHLLFGLLAHNVEDQWVDVGLYLVLCECCGLVNLVDGQSNTWIAQVSLAIR